MQENTIPKIFVIVLNYNGLATLNNCLTEIFKSDYQNFEVVVVDNNSTDNSFEKARTLFSRAHFIKNSANVGFSQGNNVGIRFALEKFADAVLILNNDAFLQKNTLTQLSKTCKQNPRAGILNPLIKDAKANIWFAGGKISWSNMRALHVNKKQSDIPYESEYLSGCAMYVTKDVFKKIGLFDERFFLYYEDADFSLRAKKAGFQLLVVPGIQITHLEQSNDANPEKLYWLVLSALLFFRIHANLYQKIWHVFYLTLRKIKNYRDIIFFTNPSARQVQRAYRDFKNIPV